MSDTKPKQNTILKVFLALIIIGIFILVSAFSGKELLGLGAANNEAANVEQNNNKDKKQTEWANLDKQPEVLAPIDLNYLTLFFNNMSSQKRERVISDKVLFKQVVENEAINRAVVSAAVANKLDEDSNIEFLMRQKGRSVLRDAYLNKLILSKLPKNFPADEQVKEYYQNNLDKFLIPERIHVWQIFLAKPTDDESLKTTKNKINDILKKIKKDKSVFSGLAIAESQHEQSRVNGGYMGLIKTNEILPSIKEPLLKLKVGELSQVIESETGFHILKRGEKQQAVQVELEQVSPKIKKLLLEQAKLQLKKEIFQQVIKEYPQGLSDTKLEEWQLSIEAITEKP